MPKNFFRTLFFTHKRNEPEIYRMTCTGCGWSQDMELTTAEVIQTEDPDAGKGPVIVSELPERCPGCGGKLKKEKIPLFIRS